MAATLPSSEPAYSVLNVPVPWLKGLDGRLQLVLDWRDPAVRRVFTLMIPVTLGLGLINVNAVIDTVFASRLIDPKLAPTAIDKANYVRELQPYLKPLDAMISNIRKDGGVDRSTGKLTAR